MAAEIVGFLLENLKQLLLYNAELIGTARDEMEGLCDDLLLFKDFIKDSTEKRNSTSNTLQTLVDGIRNVVHKAEDVIDKFVVQSSIYKARSAAKKAFRSIDHLRAVRATAKEIEQIRGDVNEIYNRVKFCYDALNIERLPDRGAAEKKPPAVEEENVVGFDEQSEILIERLIGEDQDLEIITIMGMPGLGKTTLARKIYNDPTINLKFSTTAWVYISQNYSRKEVFVSILSTITQQKTDANTPVETIADKLRNILKKEKYLIVMDDVWTNEAWNDFKNYFPDNKNGSRILITSRDKKVALCANPTGTPHNLKFLTEKESWELLKNKVFGKGKCPHGDLQTIGENIAAKCKGVPLAIVVIAGILLDDRGSSDWWKQVAENVKTFIVKDKIQFMEVIAMSYNHLPGHLKSCFLYLGVFPREYKIPVWKLIHLWIAEGFIGHDGERSLEDIAEACLMDLVNKNLSTAAERRSNGQIKTCHVHDILYDFCTKEAGEQKFYQEIKKSHEVITLDNTRRVCIHSNILNYIKSNPRGQHVRTFLSFPPNKITLPLQHIPAILIAFQLLRVLDIKSIIFTMFPEELLQLVLLKYLALSCDVSAFKSSISKLWSMQTLIFKTKCPILKLEDDLWNMYQLRHLHTNASVLLTNSPLNKSVGRENLQSLSMLAPESCTKNVLERTPNIKKLGVRGKVAVLFDNSFDNVGKLLHLTSLKLYNHPESIVRSLPPANKFPEMLKKLTLANTLLDWKEMQILGSLAKLEVLKLKENAFKGQIWEPKDDGFLCLKHLYIGKTNLVSWEASKRHFPSIRRLVLNHCEDLEEVPSCFAEISSFQELELYHSNMQAAFSARKIETIKLSKAIRETKTRGEFKLTIYPSEG